MFNVKIITLNLLITLHFKLFSGVKCCLHIHGIYPYIFVQLESLDGNDKSNLYNFANSLDKAICLTLGAASSKSKHIHNITVVSGK